jgi:hypothetical protein
MKRKKNSRPAGGKSSRRAAFRRLAALLFYLAAAGGGILGARYAGSRVSGYPEFNLVIERVELDAASCDWLPEDAKEAIEAIPGRLPNLNLLCAGVLEEVKKRLEESPWVKQVISVEKVFPDRIRFSLVLRRPVAWVSLGNGLYLADSEGVRLSVERRDHLKVRNLPVIENLPQGVSLPGHGAKWRSAQVLQGISAACCLIGAPEVLAGGAGRVRAIDVSGAGRGGKGVVLVTEDGRRIEWGEAASSGKIQLLSDAEKLENLRLILRAESSLDNRSYYRLWTRPPTAGPPGQTVEAAN